MVNPKHEAKLITEMFEPYTKTIRDARECALLHAHGLKAKYAPYMVKNIRHYELVIEAIKNKLPLPHNTDV